MARTPFNLKKELGILAAVVLPEAEGKGLEFSLEIAPDVPLLLMGDALRVRQVLLNLCNNAVKFTDEGSGTSFPEENGRRNRSKKLEIYRGKY